MDADRARPIGSPAMLRRAVLCLSIACAGCGSEPLREPEEQQPPVYVPVVVPRIEDRSPKPPRIIYLNREGARLLPGRDEASRNESAIVQLANLEQYDVPAFRGTHTQWNAMVSCLREHFAPYAVRIVEQRPVVPGYMMAVMGGEPGPLGAAVQAEHGHAIAGLAPFNGQPVENAVVLIFTRTLRENTKRTCETAAMEIAHAFGLDHAMHCGDLMSYLRPCGARRFQDRAVPCGEHEERECGNGEPSQSSHQRLLEVLGPAEP
jgi:hypothetical protein